MRTEMEARLLHKINRWFCERRPIFVLFKESLHDCKITAANSMYNKNSRVFKFAYLDNTSLKTIRTKFNQLEKSIGLESSVFESVYSGNIKSPTTINWNGAEHDVRIIKIKLSKGWLYNRVFLTLALQNIRSLSRGGDLEATKLIEVLKKNNFKEYFTKISTVKNHNGYPDDHYACLDLCKAIRKDGKVSEKALGSPLINSKFHVTKG